MIETPHVTESATQLTALIRLTVPRSEIQQVMGPSIREVLDAVVRQGRTPVGPWFTYHFQRPTDVFDFEVCVPVASAIAPEGRVKPGQLAAAKVARTVYHGPYEGLAAAWCEFQGWIAAQGHAPAAPLWERYLVGPETSPDPAVWRTELNQPLIG